MGLCRGASGVERLTVADEGLLEDHSAAMLDEPLKAAANVWRQWRAQRSCASPLHAGVRRGCGSWKAATGMRGLPRMARAPMGGFAGAEGNRDVRGRRETVRLGISRDLVGSDRLQPEEETGRKGGG